MSYNKRMRLNNITNLELIRHLSNFDPNATVTICGSSDFYIHTDGDYITLDYSDLGEEYDESNVIDIPIERKCDILLDTINSMFQPCEHEVFSEGLEDLGAKDYEIKAILNSLKIKL